MCYKRGFDDKQADSKHAFNKTFRYFDDILNINDIYFNNVSQIYSSEIQLNKDNTSDTEIVSENDQEIPQLQTADNPMAPRGTDAQPSRDTRKTN